jgi:hypothetical protein
MGSHWSGICRGRRAGNLNDLTNGHFGQPTEQSNLHSSRKPQSCGAAVPIIRSQRTYGLEVFSHVVRRNSTVGAALNLRTCKHIKPNLHWESGGIPNLLIRLVSVDDVVG